MLILLGCGLGVQIVAQNCSQTHRFRDICQESIGKINGSKEEKRNQHNERSETKSTQEAKGKEMRLRPIITVFSSKAKCKQHSVHYTTYLWPSSRTSDDATVSQIIWMHVKQAQGFFFWYFSCVRETNCIWKKKSNIRISKSSWQISETPQK